MDEKSALYQRIKCYLESKNYPAALRELRQEVEANPDDPQLLFWLGACLAEIHEFTEAVEYLERAAELDPTDAHITTILDAIQTQKGGEEIRRPVSAMVFDVGEPVEYKKKECPQCQRRIGVEAWQCGYCRHLFLKRILVQLGIFIVCANVLIWLLGGWYGSFMGFKFQKATVVNNAGEDGLRIRVSNLEWNCVGLGLTQARGTGLNGTVRGKIKNNLDRAIEKATFTIILKYDNGNDVTFVWFDVFSWKPGEEIQFEFLGISPPGRPDLCDLRVEYVKPFSAQPSADLKPEFYVPSSRHFPSYRFSEGARTLAERSYKYYQTAEPWTLGKVWRVYVDMLPAFLFNYFCVMLAVILVNVCDPDRKWNAEWKMDAVASAFVVIGFVVVNLITGIIGAVMVGHRFFYVVGFILKLQLFYFFFRRSIGFTVVMVIFYVCLTMGLMGLWYNIAGTPKPIPRPQIEMEPGTGGGMMPLPDDAPKKP